MNIRRKGKIFFVAILTVAVLSSMAFASEWSKAIVAVDVDNSMGGTVSKKIEINSWQAKVDKVNSFMDTFDIFIQFNTGALFPEMGVSFNGEYKTPFDKSPLSVGIDGTYNFIPVNTKRDVRDEQDWMFVFTGAIKNSNLDICSISGTIELSGGNDNVPFLLVWDTQGHKTKFFYGQDIMLLSKDL